MFQLDVAKNARIILASEDHGELPSGPASRERTATARMARGDHVGVQDHASHTERSCEALESLTKGTAYPRAG